MSTEPVEQEDAEAQAAVAAEETEDEDFADELLGDPDLVANLEDQLDEGEDYDEGNEE